MIDPNDVRIVLDGFEKGVFVRSIEGDDRPEWAIDLLPYLSALARLQVAIDGPKEAGAPRRRLAEEIAGSLFVSGFGEHAERLVLTVDGPPKRDLGGWCVKAVVDIIAKALAGVEAG